MILRLCIVALLFAAQPAWAQSDQGLPAPGATITLKPTPSGYEAGIIIARDAKYTDAAISTTDPMLAKILGQRIDKEPMPAISPPATAPGVAPPVAKPQEPPKTFVKLVTVVVTSGAIRQGNYPLTLIVTGEGNPQVRDLMIIVPPAKIDPPETLVVVSDRWRRSNGLTANQPQVWETAQRAWLTHLSLEQKGNTDADGKPAGRIVAKDKLKDIPPGQSELIELDKQFSLVGDFPLGTAKGKLVLQADQLADPVTFGFEVRSRIWVCWLFLPMGIGLALGALTRKVLTNTLQLNQERENTYALIALIDRAVARNADTIFGAAAAVIRQAALAAADLKTAAEVKNATTPQQTAFQAALDALSKRRGDLDKDIAALLMVVRGYYRLPAALAAKVNETKDSLEAGLPGLADNDVGTADARLQEMRNSLRGLAGTSGRDWVDRTKNVAPGLDILAPFQPAAIADLKTYWTAGYKAVSAAVQQLEEDTSGSLDKLQAVLQALHVAANTLHNIMTNVAAVIRGVAAGWAKLLEGAKLPDVTVWQDWLKDAVGFAAAIEETPSTDLGDAVLLFGDKADALLADLKTSLAKQVADPVKLAELGGLLDAGKLTEAVTLVANVNRAPQVQKTDDGRVLGPAPASGAEAAKPMFSVLQFSPLPTTLPAGTVGFTTPPRADVTPVDVLAAAARRNVQATNFFLSLVYAALIAGAGYFLFADKWIGTPLDFALVFFWAYATDIGADAATAAAKGVKKP